MVRYVDQDILATLRFFFVAATRLEFSLQVMALPPRLVNAATSGIRSMHPFPYSFAAAMNTGSSTFGFDLKQHFEQQNRTSKQLLDAVSA